jgi:DNA primase
MAGRRSDEWDRDYQYYSEDQIEGILGHCGVEIVSDIGTHFMCLCPFHGNTNTAAFEIDKHGGGWICFNPSCDKRGSLRELIKDTKGGNPFEIERVILKYKSLNPVSFEERLAKAMEKAPDFVEFPANVLERLSKHFPGSAGEAYMHTRGFLDDTLSFFEVGYSDKKNMVVVPMHDAKGMPIGIIGRAASSTDKTFKNSTGLPKSRTAWNFHRAKRHGGTIIVCESSFDGMRIHQAGYPNVVALLGGHFSDFHMDQLNKHFSTIIIMTDFENELEVRPNCKRCKGNPPNEYGIRCVGHRAGRDLGRSIAEKLPNKKILWAAYDDVCVYPHKAKDASDMTDEEIRQCLTNAVSNIEYVNWNIESMALAG